MSGGRALIVKLSAMGDIIHALPALMDAARARPDWRFDWVCEKNHAELLRWGAPLANIHTLQLREWKRAPLQQLRRGSAAREAIGALRARRYDCVIDAQGLLKSAITARIAAQGAPIHGPDAAWAREKAASRFYTHPTAVDAFHVVARNRQLFAHALGYALPHTAPDFGVKPDALPTLEQINGQLHGPLPSRYLLLLHGCGWSSKAWPESYWAELIAQIGARNWGPVLLPWGGEAEKARAERLAQAAPQHARVLPRLGLSAMARIIHNARAVVGLDSGFAHLAGAMEAPVVTLYGATNPDYSGVAGAQGVLLHSDKPCAPCMLRRCPLDEPGPIQPPCFATLPPSKIISALESLLTGGAS
ncbi:lipopolysaccharide heptosyltransferase I [Magnetofaba australis]|uniref:Lipopolysaccharide heptosyltransferase 1 n=1 Tax=Magnetofaba australis IT-1 TaxID=1434232 RepID=A0A1Y2K830_9PROT|nr:lipopolysaccharide heptosyltransferase I [Magnetofaba australis]OSM04935.1 putative lipopolysaccharide heptosyltransferase I [Magnetofaba australis IT-1]